MGHGAGGGNAVSAYSVTPPTESPTIGHAQKPRFAIYFTVILETKKLQMSERSMRSVSRIKLYADDYSVSSVWAVLPLLEGQTM